MNRTLAIFFFLVVFTIITSASPSFATTYQVSIVSGSGASASANCVGQHVCFNPNPVTIAVGDTVTWTNDDTVSHTSTFDQQLSGPPVAGAMWDSGLIKAGGTYSFTFNTVGTFAYNDQVHPWMTGEVVVGAAPPGNSAGNYDFILKATPSNLSIAQGSSEQFAFNVAAPSTNSGPMDLSISMNWVGAAPSGVNLSSLQSTTIPSLAPNWNSNQFITINAPSASSLGNYILGFTVTVTNPSGIQSKQISVPISITPPPTPQPSPPAILKANPVSTTQIDLSWAQSAGAVTGYTLERSATQAVPWTVLVSNTAATSYNDAGLTPGTTYYYRVFAENSAGQSAPTTASATTQSEPISAPLLSVSSTTSDTVTLSWTSTQAPSYKLERSSTQAGPWGPVQSGITATSFTDTNLTPGTTYYYRVTADMAGGLQSNTVPATTGKHSQPDFALSASPTSIQQGNGGTSTISVTQFNDFNSPVIFSLGNNIPGIIGSFSPNPDPNTSILTLNVDSSVPTGPYQLVVVGTSGSLTHPTSFTLQVNQNTPPSPWGLIAGGIGAAAVGGVVVIVMMRRKPKNGQDVPVDRPIVKD